MRTQSHEGTKRTIRIVETVRAGGDAARSTADSTARPVAQPVTEPVTQSATQSSTQPVTQSVTRSSTHQRARYALTSRVGRDAELADLKTRATAPNGQILTVTGPVGVGKSRLANALFEEISGEFAHGGRYLELDALRPQATDSDAGLARAVVDALDQRPSSASAAMGDADAARAPLDLLRDRLAGRDFLLILDCGNRPPHGIAELWEAVASAARRLCLLTVSTQVLGMYGEHRVPLLPLAVPTPGDTADLGRLGQVDSVRLLVDRTKAVRPGFRLTQENRETVAKLCQMLDGLPLSIELAASRLKVSSPRALLDELSRSPGTLTDADPGTATGAASEPGATEPPACPDTLGLAPQAVELLMRLGVFTETFGVAEAAGVFELPLDITRQALAEMVDHSALLTEEQRDGSIRFWMLRGSRARALEHLGRQDALGPVRADHAVYFLRQMHSIRRQLEGPGQTTALEQFGHWHQDVLAALEFLAEVGNGEAVATLATAAQPYWLLRGEVRSAAHWLSAALGLGIDRHRVRLAALEALGEALLLTDEPAAARPWLDEALAAYTERGDGPGTATVRQHQARLAQIERNLPAAETLLTLILTDLDPRGGGQWCRGAVLARLAEVRRDRGDTVSAARHATEAVRLFERAEDTRSAARAKLTLAGLTGSQGDFDRAEQLACRALLLLHDRGDLPEVARGLAVLAELLTHKYGRTAAVWERAARLLGAADALRRRVGDTLAGQPEAVSRSLLGQVSERMGRSAFDTAWQQGGRCTPDEAVTLALTLIEPPDHQPRPTDLVGSLTRREHEVAMLVTEGLTNREVARRLGIAEWTAVNHMRKVMQKLGCTSRVQVAGRMLRPLDQRAAAPAAASRG
ncbi:LuxR C-terminal-related transcriptional regulator [Streptomyces sp. NBC_01511]|uniref:ATP-binding protein n=1 Tax=Streptomyces sp. NBC_01511 TaxID=2903889 RepID=UPI00386B9AB5